MVDKMCCRVRLYGQDRGHSKRPGLGVNIGELISENQMMTLPSLTTMEKIRYESSHFQGCEKSNVLDRKF